MEAVRVLLVVLCFAVVGRCGLPDSGVVSDEDETEVAEVSRSIGTGKGGERSGDRIIAAAEKEIGVQESMENSGKRVDEYNAYVGLRKVAWCASFVSWCHGQAGYPQPRTAWSPALFPVERLAKKAMRGMVMGIYYPEKGRIAHCGIVAEVKDDLVYAVEGNTNVNGSREGDGVYKKIRHKKTIAKYADWTGGRIGK